MFNQPFIDSPVQFLWDKWKMVHHFQILPLSLEAKGRCLEVPIKNGLSLINGEVPGHSLAMSLAEIPLLMMWQSEGRGSSLDMNV